MDAEPVRLDAAQPRLAARFRRLCALERAARALEALAIAAACSWILLGVAESSGMRSDDAALVPALVAGALAGASWLVERWRSPRELARRADRALEAHELILTALEDATAARHAPAWRELLGARALALWDGARLWRSIAPRWSICAALLLVAFGVRELGQHALRSAQPAFERAEDWAALAAAVEAQPSAAVPGSREASARAEGAELAAELRAAGARERSSEMSSAQASELLSRARRALERAPAGESSTRLGREAGERLTAAYPAERERPSGAGALPGSSGASPSGGGGRGVPSDAPDGTMAGSTGGAAAPATSAAGSTGSVGSGVLHASLSARWWPSEQDTLVEAWLEQQQRDRSKR